MRPARDGYRGGSHKRGLAFLRYSTVRDGRGLSCLRLLPQMGAIQSSSGRVCRRAATPEAIMPRRTDISSILIIGAGPIVIGQACEFDYSGTQAIKALKEEGYRIVLVNSNPATIMTDPELADATYVEPITPEFVRLIIEEERPDAVLPA